MVNLKLKDNNTQVSIVLDYAWRTFDSALNIPFDNDSGEYVQGEWDLDKLESLVGSADPPGRVIHQLLKDKKISSPDNLLYLADIIAQEERQGFGTDALHQLYEQVRQGIDVSELSNYDRGKIRPQRDGLKFYEYLMGEVTSPEGIGFFTKHGFEDLGNGYKGISLR